MLGNQARNAKDLYILSVLYYGVHGGEPIYEISERMLGGAPYHWKDESDQLVKPADLKGKLPDGSEIFLHTDETLTDAVRRLGKVLISGNKSTTRGGGIGSNGTVIIGEEGPEKKVEVVKTWEKGLTPAPITVALRAKMDDLDWLIETAELNVANGFKHTFDHLPATVNDQPIESLLYIKETTVSDQYTADVSDIKLVDPEKTFSFKVERPDVSDNESIYAVYGNYYEARPELGMLNDKGELKDFTVYYHLKDKRDGHVISSQGMIYDSEDADRPYPVWQGSILFNDVPMAGEKVVVRYYAPEKEKYFSPVLFAYDIFLDREGDTTVVYMPKIKPSIPVMHGTDTGDEKVLFLEDLAVHNSTEPIFRISVHNKKPSDQPRLREITVVKRWIGDEAPSIEVQLLRNEQLIDQATLTKAQGWRHTFKDLPVNDDKGVAYTYRVAEKAMPGYTPSITWDPQVGFIIVNKKDTPPGTPPGNPPGEPNQRRVYVNKTWLGPAGKEAIIYLLADGEVIDRAVLTESNQWQHIFGQLAKSKDGKRIQYTIKEEPVPGYRSQINGNDRDGFQVINIHENNKINIPVTKTWIGGETPSIEIRLYRDGQAIDTVTISKYQGWHYLFKDLPAYDQSTGHIYRYTIQETPISGYTATISGDERNGFFIVNRKEAIPPTPPVHEEPPTPPMIGKQVPKTGHDPLLAGICLLLLGGALRMRQRKQG